MYLIDADSWRTCVYCRSDLDCLRLGSLHAFVPCSQLELVNPRRFQFSGAHGHPGIMVVLSRFTMLEPYLGLTV
jgi:hypothetical protein